MGDKSERWRRIAELIKQRMAILNLSPADVSRAAGVDANTLRDLRKGERTGYRDSTLRGVSSALGWSRTTLEEIAATESLEELVASLNADANTVESAIAADRNIDEENRSALLTMYRSARQSSRPVDVEPESEGP